MKYSHLSTLTVGMLLGQNLMGQASANPLCPSQSLLDNSSPDFNHCLPNTAANFSPDLMASISFPETLNLPISTDTLSPSNAETTQLVSWLNSPYFSKNQNFSHGQMTGLSTLLLNFILSPIGAIAFLLLIKPWIVQGIIKDIRQQISELGELELQLSTASQKADLLSTNFQAKLETLAAGHQQEIEKFRSQLNQQGLSAQQFESIKSDWLTQLQHLVLEVYDARDKALEKIARIHPDTLIQKLSEQFYQHYENRPQTTQNQDLINSGKVNSEKVKVEDYLHQGNQLLQQGYYADAVLAYNQAISLNPNQAEAWYNRGNALGCLQKYSEALAAYERAIALQPERADFWANRGHILVRLQQHSEAIASYDKAIALQPGNPEYWQHKGSLFARLQKYSEALTAYDQASLLAPEKYEVWHLKGNLLAKLQQTEQAAIAYKQAVNIDPKKYESWYNLGNALGQLQRYVESVNAYNQAIQLKNDDYKVWHNRGFMLGKMQQYEAAITSYEKAITLNQKNYESWYNRGNLLEQLHRYNEAIASYDKAIEIKPDDPRLWYNCGKLLEKLQRFEEAVASYKRAINIQPEQAEEARLSLNYLMAKLHHESAA
jgi:tetratricopeptide (TPR) repeat protein